MKKDHFSISSYPCNHSLVLLTVQKSEEKRTNMKAQAVNYPSTVSVASQWWRLSIMAPVRGSDEVQELCVRWMCLLSSSSQTLQNGCHGTPGYCGKTGIWAWSPESPVEYILRAWSSVCPVCKDWKKSEGCGPSINLGEILNIHQEEWTFLLTFLFSWWQIFLFFR